MTMTELDSGVSKAASASAIGGTCQFLKPKNQPLDVFFTPKTVAVIGATETPKSVGRTVLWNLVSNPFGGTIFPVNPKRSNVLGIKAYPDIGSVPEGVDLAVIVTPAPTVPGIIRECVEAKVGGSIIISAGFKECGEDGAALEKRILTEARRGRMRVIGPNCLGVMSPVTGLNATFAGTMARPGNVAFVSQSGALCTAVLDWSLRELVGFSAFVSIGSMLDVGWGDLIDYLVDDPKTRSIVMYMESVGDARAFLSAAREAALTKPIVVIKAGRSEAAARAAASHTGALVGSQDILDAAFRRSGVLQVDKIADLFYMAEVLSKQPRPKGPHLTILTNAGGPGVLATDALIASGGGLAEVSKETIEALNRLLPPHWSHNNPIDILGDAPPERYEKTVELAIKDPNSDGLLVILTPQAMTDPTRTAEQLKVHARGSGKPILASWMGGVEVAAGEAILNQVGVPTFPYPDTAARAFQYMWRYSDNLRALYETPMEHGDFGVRDEDRALVDEIIAGARSHGRTILSEYESKRILAAYGIPVVDTRIAHTEMEAVKHAEALGFPVVLKVHSTTVTHKSDAGGVRLKLTDAVAVRRAFSAIRKEVTEKAGESSFQGVTAQPMIDLDGYEVILGSIQDPQFGPVILFGSGGQLVEVFEDRALALPPLNSTLARRMMEQTRIFKVLRGVRGRKPVDVGALEVIVSRFSQLVVEQRWIREVDINPFFVSSDQLIALDSRVVLHSHGVKEEDLPRPAIRPYPTQYASPWKMKNGKEVLIRPIRPEDEPLMVKFHETLSDRSVYYRYFHPMRLSQRVAHERLTRMCFIDYAREMALVVESRDAGGAAHEILAIGRLIKLHGTSDAEFAILVSDQYQHSGLGTELLRRLVEIGRAEKLERITADILPDNYDMQRVCEKLGFQKCYELGAGVVKVLIDLTD